MRHLRPILVWLAMIVLLAPGASGSVLCIESNGSINIEQSHFSPGCAPMCAADEEHDTQAPVPDECVDLSLVDRVSQSIRTDLPTLNASVPALLSDDLLTLSTNAAQRLIVQPPGLYGAQRSLRSTVLRI